jgi:hypothetical protein
MVRVTSNGVPLPSWADATSIAGYATSAFGVVLALLTIVRPSLLSVNNDATIQGLIPLGAVVIASVVQMVNIIRHTTVTKAVLVAGTAVRVLTRAQYKALPAPVVVPGAP